MKVNAVIDRQKFNDLLKVHKWSIVDFHELLRKEGLPVEYQAFGSILNGRTAWSLTYAMLVCKVLNLKVEDIFYLHVDA